MATATLKARIDKLIDDLGGSSKPTVPQIRSLLTQFSAIADALESGQSAAEAEAKITTLEATIKELESNLAGQKIHFAAEFKGAKAQFDAQLQRAEAQEKELQAALEAAKAEIESAKEQAQQQDEPLTSVESRILHFVDVAGETTEWHIKKHLELDTGDAAQSLIDDLVEEGFLKARDNTFTLCYRLSKKGRMWIATDRLRTNYGYGF